MAVESHKLGEVGTEIAPEIAGDSEVAERDGGYRYGLLQLSDKPAEADFTEEDELRIRELAVLVGAALDALRFSRA